MSDDVGHRFLEERRADHVSRQKVGPWDENFKGLTLEKNEIRKGERCGFKSSSTKGGCSLEGKLERPFEMKEEKLKGLMRI